MEVLITHDIKVLSPRHFAMMRAASHSPGVATDDSAFEGLQQTLQGADPAHFGTIQTALRALEYLRDSSETRWARLFMEHMRPLLTGEVRLSFWSLSAPDFWTDVLAQRWEKVEALPCFNDAERLLLVNFILACARYCEGALTTQKWRITDEDRQVFNHQTFPAKGLAAAAQYLDRREYDIPESANWLRLATKVFARAARAGRSFDEGGDGYSWLVGRHLVEGTLSLGDIRYVTGAQFKRYVDLAVMCCNNHFDMVPFGDGHGYHTSSYNRKNSNAAAILLAAAKWQREPSYRWIAERHAPEVVAISAPGDVPAPPLHHVGMVVALMDPVIYRWAFAPIFPDYPPPQRVPTLPAEETFDKISFRAGWNADDDYALFKGFGGGMHGHPDACSIAQFQARGRLFLVEGDYIRRAPRDHNMLQIIRDGSFDCPLMNARLDEAQSFAGGAVVTATLPQYNGCDWQRTLFWLANDYMLVIDTVTALQAGIYDVSCYWRTLGSASQTPRGLITEHQGEWFRIIELTDSDRSLELGDAPLNRQGWWPYKFGDAAVKVLRQRHRGYLNAGENRVFVNLLLPGGDAENAPRDIAYQKNSIVLSGGNDAIRITEGGVTRGGEELCHFARKLNKTIFSVSSSHPAKSTFAPPRHNTIELSSAVTSVHPWGEREMLIGSDDGRLMLCDTEGRQKYFYRTGARISAITSGKLFGSSNDSILVTGRDGKVLSLDASGKLRWSAMLPDNSYFPGWGIALALADLDGDGRLWPIVGTASWQVCALDENGKSRWNFQTAAHCVTDLAVADLDGDGRDEVVAGTVYFCVMAITPNGERLWQDEDYNDYWSAGPVFPFVRAADIDGDGKVETLAAGHDTLIHCIDHQGKKKWAVSIGDEPRALLLTKWGILGASRSGDVHLIDGHGNRLWHCHPADHCADAIVSDEGCWISTNEGNVFRLSPEGKITARFAVSHSTARLSLFGEGKYLMVSGDRKISIIDIGCL